jgi:maleylpyruvate isomerase
MFDPRPAIDQLHDCQARLQQRIAGLGDEVVRQPCLLPGWSIGHLLNHLARNADSVVRRLAGAVRNEIVDQYPGGPAGRAAEIESGAFASAADLITDVETTSRAVERFAAEMPGDAWERLSRSVEGELVPVRVLLAGRIKEVEIHHVDLGLGYQPQDWPDEFVRSQLAIELPKLAGRTDSTSLLGWLVGRAPAPALLPGIESLGN